MGFHLKPVHSDIRTFSRFNRTYIQNVVHQ
nr:MAG TPA: hypothetical protein [Caudoviricetes sp.]